MSGWHHPTSTAIPDAVDMLARRPDLVDVAEVATVLDCAARWSA